MKKVLIVEDDPFIRDITTIKLTEHGYGTIVADNGEAALNSLEKETPDIVLLDLDLPDLSGFAIASNMKDSERLKNVPIIIFSNRDDAETKEKAEQLDIHHFFVKASTDYEQLYTLIDSL